jgi:pyruvate formate lyase activating enzyme
MDNIKGYIPCSFSDWNDRPCTVIFLGGCNLRCLYCHNGPLVTAPTKLPDIPIEEILKHATENKAVCISGGEPTLCADIIQLALMFRKRNIDVKLDTNGSNFGILHTLVDEDLLQAVAMDIKTELSWYAYNRLTGCSVTQFGLIMQSLGYLASQTRVPVEFRTTILPDCHDAETICKIAHDLKLIGATSLKIQGFMPQDSCIDERLRTAKGYLPEVVDGLQGLVNDIMAGRKQVVLG